MEKAAVMDLSIMITGQVLQKVFMGEYDGRLFQQQERGRGRVLIHMGRPSSRSSRITGPCGGAVLCARSPHLAQSPRPARCGVQSFARTCIYGGVTGPQAVEAGPVPILFVAVTVNV